MQSWPLQWYITLLFNKFINVTLSVAKYLRFPLFARTFFGYNSIKHFCTSSNKFSSKKAVFNKAVQFLVSLAITRQWTPFKSFLKFLFITRHMLKQFTHSIFMFIFFNIWKKLYQGFFDLVRIYNAVTFKTYSW